MIAQAIKGEAQSQYALGKMFFDTEAFYDIAEKWLCKAAAQRHGDAQDLLSNALYLQGDQDLPGCSDNESHQSGN